LRLEPLLGVVVDRSIKHGDGITLVVYVPKKRLPWELRIRVNRQNLSTAATIFWSPLLPTPKFGQSVEIWVLRQRDECQPPQLAACSHGSDRRANYY
jgi:hypothetical protein